MTNPTLAIAEAVILMDFNGQLEKSIQVGIAGKVLAKSLKDAEPEIFEQDSQEAADHGTLAAEQEQKATELLAELSAEQLQTLQQQTSKESAEAAQSLKSISPL